MEKKITNHEKFWDFSVRTYRGKGVPESCLFLQDNFQVDINLLLFCCWYGISRGVFKSDIFKTALTFSQSWSSHVVIPIRNTRIWMKDQGCTNEHVPSEQCMGLRAKIKNVELEAEHLQEDVLEQLANSVAEELIKTDVQITAMTTNIKRYFKEIDAPFTQEVIAHIACIINGAIPATSVDEIKQIITA